MKKDRVTLMVCSNASGTFKMPLVFIGKSKHPRAFPKKFDFNSLPVRYLSQTKAWMTENIFIEWFHSDFVPKVSNFLVSKGLEPKAMLLVDNAPPHGCNEIKSADGKIKLYFLPPNTTSMIQPMDQGVIESLKRNYRKSFVEQILRGMTTNASISVDELWKSYNIKDAITNVAVAWDSVTQTNLAHAWNKLWPPMSSNGEENVESQPRNDESQPRIHESNEIRNLLSEANEQLTEEEVSSWLNIDSEDCGFDILSDDEIVESILNNGISDDESEEEADENNNSCTISNREAEEMICKYLHWYESKNNNDLTTSIFLRKLCSWTSKTVLSAKKQSKIDDFL